MKKSVAEIIASLPVEEVLAAIPVEQIAAFLLSAEKAKAELGVSKRRVLALANAENPDKRLPGAKVGREFVFKRSDVEAEKHRERRGGRPPSDAPSPAALYRRERRAKGKS